MWLCEGVVLNNCFCSRFKKREKVLGKVGMGVQCGGFGLGVSLV